MNSRVVKNNKCPVCGESVKTILLKLNGYNVISCPLCKNEFNADFPPKQTKELAFSEEYYKDVQKEAFMNQAADPKFDPAYGSYNKGLDMIEKIVMGRKIMDVGPGLGAFMKIAFDRGWDVKGVEVSPYGAQFIVERYHFDVLNGDLSMLKPNYNHFDAITFWDVIEHVEDPVSNLKTAHDLLKPGGLILLTSDNYNSLISVLARLIYTISFGRIIAPLEKAFTKYNRTYFNDKGMRDLLKKNGFNIVYFRKMQYPVSKLKLSVIEKIAVRAVYLLENIFGRQSQFTFIAQKRQSNDRP